MSRKVIQDYLDEIEQLLLNSSNTYIEEYNAQDLHTQPKKPGFFTKILRPYPQILSKTRFLGPHVT